MTRFVAALQFNLRGHWRLLAVSVFALLFLGACYQEVPVSSTPTADVIEAPSGAPTQPPAKEPEKKPEGGEKPAGGDAGTGGGGGGGAATPIVAASPTISCLTSTSNSTDPTVLALPTCTPISGVKLPGSPVATVAGGVKTPVSGVKPGVTPAATVKVGTAPTVKPGTTPAAGAKTAVAPTVKAGTTPMAPTVKSGTATTPPTGGSPSATVPSNVTVSPGTTISPTVKSPLLPTMTPSMTASATSETTADMGIIYVTKHENFANAIIPGACFSLLNGDTVSALVCDQQEGDRSPEPGIIGIEAPLGTYMLRETTAPEGYEPGADIEVSLVAGTPTAIDIINHLIKSTDTLIINKVDPAGTPLSGSCFDIVAADGSVTPICDDGLNDANSVPGALQIEVNSGDYTLKETPPAGYSPTEVVVSVIRGERATIQVVNVAATPSEESTTTTATGVLVISIVGADGATPVGGVCLTLTGPATYNVCDNQDADQDMTDGVIELVDLLIGDYTLTSTPPEGVVELAPLPAVKIAENDLTQTTLQFGPSDGGTTTEPTTEVTTTTEPTIEVTTTAETEPTVAPDGVVFVQALLEDGVTPLSGVCITLTGPATINICDNLEGDPEPTEGIIELDAVPPGDYTVEVVTPDGYELVSELTGLRVESGTPTPLNLTFRAIAVAESGLLLVQAVLEDGATGIAGLCVNLSGPGAFSACDNLEGDVEPTEGIIEFNPMPVGEYAVEFVPPAGYEFASELPATVQIVVDPPAQFGVMLRQIAVNGSIQINKVDAADGVTPLGGSCYELSGPAGTVAICDDDETDRDELVAADVTAGVIVASDLPAGDYIVRETQAPAGYDLAVEQTVSVGAGSMSGVTFADTLTPVQVTGNLQVLSTDQDGNPLPGACLSLVAQFGEGTVANVDLCDGGEGEGEADGQVVFANLMPGLYQITETSAPAGYRIADPVQAEIQAEGGEIQVSLSHVLASGSLLITTLDPTGAPVPTVCYSVIANDGSSVDYCDDDGDGSIIVEGLPGADFTVRLASVPEQFTPGELTEQIVTIVVDQQSTLGFTVNTAAPATVSLQVLITDEIGNPLPGSCVDLQGAQTARSCDDVENDADPNPGSILIAGLVPGEYTVTQSQIAPDHTGADPQTLTLDPANPVTQVGFVNVTQPTGVAIGIPALYADDAGRLWLLRPNDPQPTRLDSDERPWDQRVAPISSYDHVEIAFMINNPDQPAANMIWVNLQDLSQGSVDFGGVGTPVQIAWVPGRNDLLLVGVQLPTGTMNVYFFNTGNQELTGPVFPGDSEPASIDAIIPSPTSTLVAMQTTGTDGDADTWLIDSNPQAEPNLTNVGPNDGVDADFFASWSPAGDSLLVRSGIDSSMFFVTNFARNIIPIDPNPIYQGDRNAGTSPAWSADSSLISYFDNDPAAGGQLRIARIDGSPLCDPIPNVQTMVWSPTDLQLWTLMNVPDSPQALTIISADCSQQPLTSFDVPVSRLRWAPNAGALALIANNDGNASLSIFTGDSIIPIDMAKANVAFADILSWSPAGEVLAIYAGGPSVSLWVVVPGSDSPIAVLGSKVPDGANYITQVWWP